MKIALLVALLILVSVSSGCMAPKKPIIYPKFSIIPEPIHNMGYNKYTSFNSDIGQFTVPAWANRTSGGNKVSVPFVCIPLFLYHLSEKCR